jgi:hypothetical protein
MMKELLIARPLDAFVRRRFPRSSETSFSKILWLAASKKLRLQTL